LISKKLDPQKILLNSLLIKQNDPILPQDWRENWEGILPVHAPVRAAAKVQNASANHKGHEGSTKSTKRRVVRGTAQESINKSRSAA